MRALNSLELKKKELRALLNEQQRLWQAQANLGYIVLEKPIRHGWYKHLVLRDDVSRRSDAHIFQEILDRCGTECWGHDKAHADKVWDRFSRSNLEIQFPGIKKINSRVLSRLSPKARKWFLGYDWCWSRRHGFLKRYHCQVHRHYFKIAYTRAYITKRGIIDADIESRLEEIDSILKSNKYYALTKINGEGKWWMTFNHHKRVRRQLKVALSQYDEDNFDRLVFKDYNY